MAEVNVPHPTAAKVAIIYEWLLSKDIKFTIRSYHSPFEHICLTFMHEEDATAFKIALGL